MRPSSPASRRKILRVAGTALSGSTVFAGCLATVGNDENRFVDDEPEYEGWFDDVENYDGTLDKTGRDEVTVRVGAGDEGVLFDPPAIQVDPLTTVIWEWTGAGGAHNVVHEPERAAEEPAFESTLTDEAGHTYEYEFNHERVYRYYCERHRDVGMKGVVVDVH